MVDNRFNKSTVSLASLFLSSSPTVRFDDVGDVVALLGSKIDKLKPIGRRYEPKIMLSDVAHEKKLTCKELAVHLIGLNREQSAEMTNRLLVQSLSSVGPAKWMGIKLVPSLDKGHDSFPEAFYGEEMTVSQALCLEDAKPYLNHVQPGCVEGDKMNHNAFVGRLKPLAALGACSEGCIGDPAELGHGKTEIVVVVRAEVVHEIVDLGVRGMDSNMGGKNPTKGVPIMSGGTLAVDLSGGWIQEGEEIRCAISPIVVGDTEK